MTVFWNIVGYVTFGVKSLRLPFLSELVKHLTLILCINLSLHRVDLHIIEAETLYVCSNVKDCQITLGVLGIYFPLISIFQ